MVMGSKLEVSLLIVTEIMRSWSLDLSKYKPHATSSLVAFLMDPSVHAAVYPALSNLTHSFSSVDVTYTVYCSVSLRQDFGLCCSRINYKEMLKRTKKRRRWRRYRSVRKLYFHTYAQATLFRTWNGRCVSLFEKIFE